MLFDWFLKKFKKKESTIRWYSTYDGVIDLYPITRSSTLSRPCLQKEKYPSHVLPTSNCPGIRRISSAGFIIPAPADFEITTNGDGSSFSWRQPIVFGKGQPGTESYITSHDAAQAIPILDDPSTTLKTIVKVETPWRVETTDDIVFLQVPITYNNESRFIAAHGILDPKFSHVINIQLFWKVLNGTELVRAGTPLCQYIPIKRSDLNMSDFNVIVENATERDWQKERAYNFAANSVILDHDVLASRMTKANKILTKYKTIGDKHGL